MPHVPTRIREAFAGSTLMSVGGEDVVRSVDQLLPPSVDICTRQGLLLMSPVTAYSLPVVLGWWARRFTYLKFALFVLASWNQLTPPFVLLKMPAPGSASRLKNPSPVPAERMFEFVGAMTKDVTARLARKTSTA